MFVNSKQHDHERKHVQQLLYERKLLEGKMCKNSNDLKTILKEKLWNFKTSWHIDCIIQTERFTTLSVEILTFPFT